MSHISKKQVPIEWRMEQTETRRGTSTKGSEVLQHWKNEAGKKNSAKTRKRT